MQDPATGELSSANASQLEFRRQLQQLFETHPLPPDQLLFNLGLFTRSSVLVKFLVMNDIYERIKDIPGALMEFGVWWGQNLVLLENLRAIHEPFNKQRQIVGFDTFEGYRNFSDRDVQSEVMTVSSYVTPPGYQAWLAQLLEVHEGNNAFGHNRGLHRLIAGDAAETVPRYFQDHPETLVAMAFFDIGTYTPTKAALEAIKPHLVPGSVIVLDQLTWPGAPGEAVAFKEVFADVPYRLEKCRYYPSKSLVTIR